jgi:hypothetical protein
MQELLVILQEGFDGDDVTIMVNGKEAHHEPGASTKLLLGMAAEISVELPAKGSTVGVEIPARGLSAEITVHGRPRSVLASVEEGELVLREGTGREAFL